MKLTADDALQLSRDFRELAVALGDYRFGNWRKLTPKQRRDLEDREWTLLNAASDLTTEAVGLILDEAMGGLQQLRESTGEAKKAIRTLKRVAKGIKIAAAAVGLAGAIAAKDPGAIAKNAKTLYDAATA